MRKLAAILLLPFAFATAHLAQAAIIPGATLGNFSVDESEGVRCKGDATL